MSVHIRLTRKGKKKQPFYRIVAIDSRRARDGRFLETIGTYDPVVTPASVSVKEDRLTAWLNDGAQPSNTVSSLLTQIGFLEKYELAKQGKDVSEMELKTTIAERKKRTRKMKKAAAAAVEAAAAEAEKKEADKKAAAEAAAAEAEKKEAEKNAAAEATEEPEAKTDKSAPEEGTTE